MSGESVLLFHLPESNVMHPGKVEALVIVSTFAGWCERCILEDSRVLISVPSALEFSCSTF